MIAIKNPVGNDNNSIREYYKQIKEKKISLIDIIYLICQRGDKNQKPLTFEMEQLIYESQLNEVKLKSKKTFYEVRC